MAVNHINQELRAQLPDFMRARSCPWSLSARDEWVWCVPDLQPSPTSQQQHPPPTSQIALSSAAPSSPPHDSFSATSLTMETGLPKSLLFASINNTAASPSSSASRRLWLTRWFTPTVICCFAFLCYCLRLMCPLSFVPYFMYHFYWSILLSSPTT